MQYRFKWPTLGILAYLLTICPLADGATTFKLSGHVAFDKSSIKMEISITGIDKADLPPGGSLTDYKKNLQIILPKAGSDTPIRTSRGSASLPDVINDYYWDQSNASVTQDNQDVNSVDLTYKITIYENKEFFGSDSFSDIFESTTAPETINVQAEFWKYSEGDNYEKKSASEPQIISVNYAAVTSVPSISSVAPLNKGMKINFSSEDNVTYTDEVSRKAPRILITIFQFNAAGPNIDLSSASTIANTTNGSDTPGAGLCMIDQSLVGSQNSCISSCSPTPSDNVFLEAEALALLQKENKIVYSALIEPGAGSYDILGLEVGSSYGAFLQYERGVNHSTCLTTKVIANVSLTELNGEQDAKLSNEACFIATATYGSSSHRYLDALRWFRDTYLLSNPFGKEFVRMYYRYSPAIAQVIEQNEVLRQASLFVLTPAALAVTTLRNNGPIPLFLCLSLLFIFLVTMIRKRVCS